MSARLSSGPIRLPQSQRPTIPAARSCRECLGSRAPRPAADQAVVSALRSQLLRVPPAPTGRRGDAATPPPAHFDRLAGPRLRPRARAVVRTVAATAAITWSKSPSSRMLARTSPYRVRTSATSSRSRSVAASFASVTSRSATLTRPARRKRSSGHSTDAVVRRSVPPGSARCSNDADGFGRKPRLQPSTKRHVNLLAGGTERRFRFQGAGDRLLQERPLTGSTTETLSMPRQTVRARCPNWRPEPPPG